MTLLSTSPFSPAQLDRVRADGDRTAQSEFESWNESLAPPFVGHLSSVEDSSGAGEDTAVNQIAAELEDDEFAEAIDSLIAEGSGRYLRALNNPYGHSDLFAREEPARWLSSVGERTDAILSELEAQLGDRTLESLREDEFTSALGALELESAFTSPADAQEFFWKSVVKSVKKAVSTGVSLAKKGVAAVADLTLGPLLNMLRGKAAALLALVLKRISGSALAQKFPPALRPILSQLAAKMGVKEAEAETESLITGNNLAEWFDEEIAAAMVDGGFRRSPAAASIASELEQEFQSFSSGAGGDDPLVALDRARASLTRELVEAQEGVAPIKQMERFLPAVLAAKPAIKLAIKAIGRPRIENLFARPIAVLLAQKIGQQAANQISRHLASAGLGLLGFEAEAHGGPGVLGAEALVATAEETIDRVLELPVESLENEMLVAAEVQEAFAEAAARHLPSAVLRTDLTGAEDEAGVWMLMPRGGSHPSYRFLKRAPALSLTLTPTIARGIVLGEGETLESRLRESGNDVWPVEAEVELYELLPGGTPGHLNEFETTENSLESLTEFEQLAPVSAAALTRNAALGGDRHYARIKVNGAALRKRSRFALRADTGSETPTVSVRLFLGERDAHLMSGALDKKQMLQVVAHLRRILNPALTQAMAVRLARMMGRRKFALPAGADQKLAAALTAGILRATAERLPAAAPALAQAAKDAAAGVTLEFAFTFPNRSSLKSASGATVSALNISAGIRRD